VPADLTTISLFHGLRSDEVRPLAERAAVRAFPKDAIIIREGELPDALYIIARGKVKVYLNDANGKELLLDTKGAGQYFGEMMLDDKPRSASVMTLEPSDLVMISRADFKAFLLKHPEVSLQVIRNLIGLARGQNVRTREDVHTRDQLRGYIEQLKATRAQDLPSVKRWLQVKRWALAALLVMAILMYYFMGVFVEMLKLPGVSTFIS
jgi:CRP-like cAMP-binding protein